MTALTDAVACRLLDSEGVTWGNWVTPSFQLTLRVLLPPRMRDLLVEVSSAQPLDLATVDFAFEYWLGPEDGGPLAIYRARKATREVGGSE